MTHKYYDREIMQMVAEATDAARRRFAVETIALLRSATATAVKTKLPEIEREVLTGILNAVECGSLDGLEIKVKHLMDNIRSGDPADYPYDPDIRELICAIDALILYSATGDPHHIARIGLSMVNTIDHTIGGNSEPYLIQYLLAAPNMGAEFERQRRILKSP